jgi:glutaconate CoA-transferase subunit A
MHLGHRPSDVLSLRFPERTALLAHGVVRAPFGAHPFSSPGFYLEDREHIARLVNAGRTFARSGDRAPFEAYWRS